MTEVGELEQVGELGHGSCGHVVKMKHSKAGVLMAVKVCQLVSAVSMALSVL